MGTIINWQEYESLNDISLIWACIEPAIQKARGKNSTIKHEVYLQLNKAQQALFMFQILYGHTHDGIEDFFSHCSYLLSNAGMWSQLKNGMAFFGAYDMVRLLEKMSDLYDMLKTEEHNRDSQNLSMRQLNMSLHDILPKTIALVGAYIRNNHEMFLVI